MKESVDTAIDLGRVIKLRLVVARHGEMDCARWWNTKVPLECLGKLAVSYDFLGTNHFKQAHIVSDVTRNRFEQIFDSIVSMTPCNFQTEIEAQFKRKFNDSIGSLNA